MFPLLQFVVSQTSISIQLPNGHKTSIISKFYMWVKSKVYVARTCIQLPKDWKHWYLPYYRKASILVVRYQKKRSGLPSKLLKSLKKNQYTYSITKRSKNQYISDVKLWSYRKTSISVVRCPKQCNNRYSITKRSKKPVYQWWDLKAHRKFEQIKRKRVIVPYKKVKYTKIFKMYF